MDAESLSLPDVEAILSYAALGLIVGFGYYMSMRLELWPSWPASARAGCRC